MTAADPAAPAGSRLRQVAARAAAPVAPPGRQCELCGEALPDEHRHVLEVAADAVLCACRACSILFDADAAGGERFRLVPDRRRELTDLRFEEADWAALGVPVGLAFFFHSSAEGEVVARYPSPAGPVQSTVDTGAWHRLVGANPELGDLTPDVEALLVHHLRDEREHWVVPIDDCYRLVGLFRTHWKGFHGGDEIWPAVRSFFEGLRPRPRTSRR